MTGLYRYLIPIVLFLLLFHMETGGVNLPDTNQDSPPDPPQFSDNNPEEIRIGMLLPASTDRDPLAKAAREGAELAVLTANQQGGYNGRPFRLIIRTADGLWGAGSKESVKFVHEDQVVAMITALDGRNAHLAEQVAAKSHVVQLSTRATEETLSQAFVPWFFRVVPNDKQQAEAMINEIFQSRGLRIVYALHEDQFDASMGVESFEKVVSKSGFQLEGTINYSASSIEDVILSIKKGAEAIVIFGTYDSALPVVEKIRKTHPEIQVFGSLAMTFDGRIGSEYTGGCEGGIFISSRFCYTTPGQHFKELYIDRFNQMPSPAASYAYDGTNLVIEAVRHAGPDRERIRDVLREIKYDSGATGPIAFDPSGNRIAPVFFIRMIKGHPVIHNP